MRFNGNRNILYSLSISRVLRILLLSGFLVFLNGACSNTKRSIEQKHNMLNVVLNDILESENCVIVLEMDSVYVKDIVLLPNSFADIHYDSLKNSLCIFSCHAPPISHVFFEGIRSNLVHKLNELKSTFWDSDFLPKKVDVVNFDNTIISDVSLRSFTWIANHRHEKSVLYVSEPIINNEGDVLICGKLFTDNYNIDKCFLLEQDNDKYIIQEKNTAVSKIVYEPCDNEICEYEIFVGYFGL